MRRVTGSSQLAQNYFAVVVHFYEFRIAVRAATFTGRKTVEKDALILKNKTAVDLKDVQISVHDTPWKTLDIHPRCAAFRLQ